MCRLGMKADQFTFAGIFQACLAAEEGDLSLDLYRAMRRQGLPLDDVTLSALLRICAKEAGNTRALYGQGKGSRPRAVMSAAGAQLLDLLGGGEASSVATPNMISVSYEEGVFFGPSFCVDACLACVENIFFF